MSNPTTQIESVAGVCAKVALLRDVCGELLTVIKEALAASDGDWMQAQTILKDALDMYEVQA
jgi:hypothetical protein